MTSRIANNSQVAGQRPVLKVPSKKSVPGRPSSPGGRSVDGGGRDVFSARSGAAGSLVPPPLAGGQSVQQGEVWGEGARRSAYRRLELDSAPVSPRWQPGPAAWRGPAPAEAGARSQRAEVPQPFAGAMVVGGSAAQPLGAVNAQVSAVRAAVDRALAAGSQGMSDAQLRSLVAPCIQGVDVGQRTVQLCRMAIRELDDGTAPKLLKEGRGQQATLDLPSFASRVSLPTAEKTPQRAGPAMRAQLQWTLRAALHDVALAALGCKALEKLASTQDVRERTAVLTALHEVLEDKSIYRNPEAASLDLEDAILKFNSALERAVTTGPA